MAAGAVLLLIACLAPAGLQAQTARVLIVPFTIHSDQDLTFLRKGITAMLSTRLTDLGKVVMVDQAEALEAAADLPEPLNRETAAEAGRRLNAQYVAFGSLTVFGGSISTDARFVDVATRTILVSFNESGQNHGDVITHVNRFAEAVNTRVFRRPSADAATTTAPASASTAPKPTDQSQMNPEKKIWQSDGGMRIGASDQDTDVKDAALWRSRRFRFNINAVALADVDGDGRTETVFAGDNRIEIYRFEERRFHKVSAFELETLYNILTVDAADINGNGRAEIFVSSHSQKFVPNATVWEWDGQSFATIHEALFWFYRINWDPISRSPKLYGQKGRSNAVTYGPVHQLAWVENSYNIQESLRLPKGASVFGFAQGDITRDGTQNVVALNHKDFLTVARPGGATEWTSAEPFGGSKDWLITAQEYQEGQRLTRLKNDPLPDNFFWVSQRVLLGDFDGDDQIEVLVVQNQDITKGLLQRQRMYRQGRFECLVWDNVGLASAWRTRRFSGYISDYNLGDFDNDGSDELVFAVQKRVGDPVTGENKSYLVSWNPYRQTLQVPVAPESDVEF